MSANPTTAATAASSTAAIHFEFVDAWPTNWLYTQDVFVVEIGGVYYLCNPMYPGINIALSIAE